MYNFVSFGIFRALSVAIILVVVNWWMGIPMLIAFALCAWSISYGLAPMIEAQRFDGIVRGPIH